MTRLDTPARPDQEAVARVLREHIKVDATGLAPAVASAFVTGIDEAASAVLALLPPADGWRSPEGWKLVPVVPTIEMIVAATEQWLCIRAYEDRAEVIWDAMLAEAPTPPAAVGDE